MKSARERAASSLRALSVAAERAADELVGDVGRYAEWAIETLEGGGRLLFCGNGGSAATVEHIATEYVVRFRRRREPLSAIALTAGSALLTASANDFGYDQVFVRSLRALGRSGDLLIVHSTSGASPNCLAAVRAAGEMGLRTVALTGASGGELAELAELAIRAPSDDTATIQEIHLAAEHAVADHVDAHFAGDST
ncbi:MAG TPA: SIS domain-containing protein [Gemmatimonadota bacterium]|nr:SIS domain-containing protein [Gemmatimonadota bacterium]